MFWSYLLSGIIWIIQSILTWLFGGPTMAPAAYDMSSMIGSNGLVVFQLFWMTFSTFNLTLPGIALAVVFVFKGYQIIVAIYLFIKGLIPMAN